MKWKRQKMWDTLWENFMKSNQYKIISERVVNKSIRECFYQAFFLYDYCGEGVVTMKKITLRVTEKTYPHSLPGCFTEVTYIMVKERTSEFSIHFGIFDEKGWPIIARVKVE